MTEIQLRCLLRVMTSKLQAFEVSELGIPATHSGPAQSSALHAFSRNEDYERASPSVKLSDPVVLRRVILGEVGCSDMTVRC